MRPEASKLLTDMVATAVEVQRIAAGRTFAEYVASLEFRWSVERGFEIIGEALTQLRKLEPTIAERITDWKAIIGFRNVLIHGYATVKHDITWDVVQNELPSLRRELEQLLAP